MEGNFGLKNISPSDRRIVFLVTTFIFLLSSMCTPKQSVGEYGSEVQHPTPQVQNTNELLYITPPYPLNLEEVRMATPYPETVKKRKIEGIVYLKLLIDTRGIVRKVVLVESLDPELDEIAIKMSKQLRFRPAKKENKPVAVWVSLPYKFTLRE